MADFKHPDLARLARFIAALREGATVTLTPLPGPRGTYSEQFKLGRFQPDHMVEILHSVITVTKTGRTMASRFEPLDWSIDDIMSFTAFFPQETLDSLPPVESLNPDDAWVGLLLQLDAGRSAFINAISLTIVERTPDERNPCSIAITAEFGMSMAWTAGEIARY